MNKPVYSITPFTLLDYPNHTACIIWFAGCNMRCSYCYNPDIVLGKGRLALTDTERFLRSRQSLLQAVVFSGGECTMHPALLILARTAKKMGYRIKIDTNGTKPRVLKQLIDERLLDYVALDFKAPAAKHKQITKSNTYEGFIQSLDILQQSGISYEVRTTWHSHLISKDDLKTMVQVLEQKMYNGNYYIQLYRNNVPTLATLPPTEKDLEEIALATTNIQIVRRGF